MRNTLLSILFLCAGTISTAFAAGEGRLLRFPATNGSEIVFSYAGDLYKVSINGGEATRLTSHVGYEMFSRFSPDGKTLAFTGQYDGNTEVYTIPASGGEPLRVTYTATNARDDLGDRMGPNNMVMGWTPDGKNIVYRNRISSGFDGKLYTVGKEGGLSQPIPLPEGGFCCYSPDGSKLAYNRVMREFRTWKYYKGGMADDIWVYDPGKKKVENISENVAQDIMPMWAGDNIFYISDRDRTMNIFVYNTSTKQTEKVTNFTEYDVKFPSIHGNTIVFENGGYLYKMNVSDRKPEKVNITLSSDNIYARSEIKDGAKYITAISLSPDGERLAVTTRGEVFNIPAEKGVTKNITRSPGEHDRNAQWSPDGKWIAYISDATGETELWMQDATGGDPVQLTKNNDTYIRNFDWTPDSKKIVYTDRKNRINLLDVSSKGVTKILEDPISEIRDVKISPDNNWLTYSRMAKNDFSIVYVYNLTTKKEYPVTDKWYDSYAPVFSTDGKYLVFVSMRDFSPTYSNTEWNHAYTNMGGVYLALLSKDTPSPFLTPQSPKGEADKKTGDTGATPSGGWGSDPDGIVDRIIKLPLSAGKYGNLYSDGERVYYAMGQNTKVFDLKKQKQEDVADGATMYVEPGSKKALFFKYPSSIYVTDIPKGKADLKDAVDISNMKITTDYAQEWKQIFNEGWRAMRDGFYVENMHGVDWKAMKKKYEVLLPYVKSRLDLNYIIGEMIGELNVGHAYINPGEYEKAGRIQTGLLGAEISRDASSGFFRLEKIWLGASWSKDLRSPLTEPGIEAKAGEYIVAIDGVPTNSVKDMYSLLVGKANIPTELSLNSKAQLAGARKIIINPLAEEYSLQHYNWVQENIKKVDKASNGKIGYVYIPDMGVDGLNEFSRYFYPQLDKEGLIIDDRANGGGNVSPMILERLAREPYRVTMYRGSKRTGTIPDAVQVGPKVCLINKYSASDGDLFPWGFRALGLGKLIGTRTWGGIVGISGSLPFIDGTDMRVPFFTSYDPKTGDWIIENHGVDPDILIDNDPIKEWNGEDEQLDRAIEEVMKELKNRKPLPGIPAPRVWNK
ncbi:tricorn protease [Parabacteroides sp. PF5-5]|uniref:S41 family peptidase n=1 Tax=unclassified Parabacteroides TaxID=2649774 RepID=UPI0024752905|nr:MULTISPECIES: S41 family peptidase [unclassified Parabacteroides]MDH6303395.1 tricorn protease [Parabacteroides sp. PH5-39]MDH6314718.1 tricorn protease [Parabacteroides sp. PF5-13]MDH6318055.1 tricorn protease [Parabacteroides sp. PH5-13]MDH6322014.1 tricorn protease [Parabacteroides sp. PH5-8]MDH6326137.1 tricorn protease [Parabacteroides sp. PH5-41]